MRTANPSPTSIRSPRQRREVRGVRGVLELGVVGRLLRLHLEPLGQLRRGLVDHLRLDLGARLHQPLGDPLVVGAAARHRPGGVERAVGGPRQRGGAAVGLARRVRAAGEQRRDDVAVAPPRRVVQRRAAALARAVDRDAELEQDLHRFAPALGRRLVQRLGELGPHALGARGVLRRQLGAPRRGRPRTRARSARRPARPRAARRARPAARRRQAGPSATRARTGVRSFCASHAFTSAPASTSIRSTSGERPR